MELNTIVVSDALDLLRGLGDASIDMVLCDPPYATTAIEWDKSLDWASIWVELKRICKRGAACVFTASQPFTTDLIMSNRAWFRYEWIWEKTNVSGFLNVNRAPLRTHENVLVFGEITPNYYPQMEWGESYKAARDGTSEHYQQPRLTASYGNERYPKSVLEFSSVGKPTHPTEKPVDLFAYLIKTYTHPDALVLDFCIGSGTTAIAARNTGRQFIGADSDAGYVAAANLRLINSDPYAHSVLPNGSKQLSLFAGLE